MLALEPTARLYYAETTYERIVQNINQARSTAEPDTDIAVDVLLPDGRRFSAISFGYHNPGFISVSGIDPVLGQVELIIAHTNICLLIFAVKRVEEKRTIGFLGNLSRA